MKEVMSVRIAITPSSLGWQDAIAIFDEYYKAEVPIKAKFLSLFEKCQSDSVIECLFEGYLAKLFGFKVDYQPPGTVCVPVLRSVDPLVSIMPKRRGNARKARKEKEKLQLECGLTKK